MGEQHPTFAFNAAFVAAWNRGDLEGVRALLHPDLYAESHRTFTSLGTVCGRDAHEAVLSFYEAAPHCDLETHQTFQTGHAAGRWLLDNGGVALLEIPLVTQVIDGVLVRCATFNADDVGGPRQLAARWAEAVEPGPR